MRTGKGCEGARRECCGDQTGEIGDDEVGPWMVLLAGSANETEQIDDKREG